MMTLLFVAFIQLLALAIIFLVLACTKAAEGYEDQLGFHYLPEQPARTKPLVIREAVARSF